MVTRADVINNAKRYIPPRMQGWTPTNDTHVFNPANPAHTFHSGYTTGREYDVMPYVFGGIAGFNSGTQFLVRINNGECPGGWDRRHPLPAGLPGRTTCNWYLNPPGGLGYGTRVPNNLAGIDCSGYVLRCWGFTSRRIDHVAYNTRNLQNLCVEVTRANLKQGDILNRAGSHVRIFNKDYGAQVNIFESRGGGYNRAYRDGDTRGRVIHRNIAWNNNYIPYSPFPQIKLTEPVDGLSTNTRPNIRLEIRGSGELEIVHFDFDNMSILPRITRTSPMYVSYTPSYDLKPANKYILRIRAINRIAGQTFQDDDSFEIYLL
ncbi:MAG: hypothetical protein GXO75_11615 [Calditrichaeota bacterium]|nr:hypothetical protein [Calditrichota bacterium]